MVWMVFLGLGLALARGKHIAMTSYLDRFPDRARRMVRRAIDLVGLLFSLYIVWFGMDITRLVLASGQTSPTLGVSNAILYLSLPVGFALLCRALRRSACSASATDGRRTTAPRAPAIEAMIVLGIFLFAVALLFLGFEMFLVLGMPGLHGQGDLFRGPAGDRRRAEDRRRRQPFHAARHSVLHLRRRDHGARQDRPAPDRSGEDQPRRTAPAASATPRSISCMAFGSVCGSAPATVAALGRLLYPELVERGLPREVRARADRRLAPRCALLIPPSITLIIYGWLTGTSIADLFAAASSSASCSASPS